jgi:hypothetical protein
MKKLFLGILSFIYITLASGVAVNMHYCMGKLNDVEYVYNSNTDKCGKCGMDNKNGCCHTDFKIVKLADDQQLAKAAIDIAQAPAILPPVFVDLSQSIQGSNRFLALPYYSPPDCRDLPVYLSNCVFRI